MSREKLLYWKINSSTSSNESAWQSVALLSSLTFQNSACKYLQIVHFWESTCLMAFFSTTPLPKKHKYLRLTSRPFTPKADLNKEKLTSIMNTTLVTAWYNNDKPIQTKWIRTFRDLSSIFPVLLHCTFWKSNQVDSSEAVYLVLYPQFTTIFWTNLVIVHLFRFPTGNYLVHVLPRNIT